ncbi:MAG TPA: T9SS type A sorting domain-containing protein [Bacteroidia bacterium]|nr:T9SS type A sorting domain-containing protein [Bacteroidia bacterium]HNU33633.1 T9SS type A sorting domain-containing protein [Bacteroidia bacterium]
MKIRLFTALLFFTISNLIINAQTPLVKQWDYRYGGMGSEQASEIIKTNDGGFLIGGFSNSGIGGDKSDSLRGYIDYWVIKIDAAGIKQWDKTFGGTKNDQLFKVVQTSDNGYILSGSSASRANGDKTEDNRDTLNNSNDYWIVKIDSVGNKQWDKRFGSKSYDNLGMATQTSDGGYVVAGYSSSGVGGDKTQPSYGSYDYWIVKTDAVGNKVWDRVFGGNYIEWMFFLEFFANKGIVVGGSSSSGISGNKTTPNWGTIHAPDYWIVIIDNFGNKISERNLGGIETDNFGIFAQTPGNGFIIGGTSYSDSSGNKTQNAYNLADYWIIKTDSSFNIEWDRTLGADSDDWFVGDIALTHDGGYIFCGKSNSDSSGCKTESNNKQYFTWLVKLDSAGNQLWDKTIYNGTGSLHSYIVESEPGCYLIVTTTNSGIGGYKTQANWDTTNSSNDIWIIKYCDSTITTSITALNSNVQQLLLYPNPCNDVLNIKFNQNADALTPSIIRIIDIFGREVSSKVTTSVNTKLNLEMLPNGIYFIKIGNVVKKVFKAGDSKG